MARMSLLAALTALFFSCCTATAQDPQPPLQVFQLLRQLDNDDATEMSSAYKQLKEMGPGIVQFMREPYLKPNSRGMRVSTHLAWDMQQKHKIPSTKINGMEFDVIADRVWRIPRAGETTPIHIIIKLTNRSRKKMYFNDCYAFFLECIATENELVNCQGFSEFRLRSDCVSRSFSTGESIFNEPDKLRLERSEDGKLRLLIEDKTNWRGALNLKPGRYLFRYAYNSYSSNNGGRPLADGTPQWVGKSQGLSPFVVEIK